MAGGYVDLHSVQESSAKLQLNRINAEELSSDLVFAGMLDRVKSDPSLLKKINGVFLYNITKDGKVVSTWSKLKQFFALPKYSYLCVTCRKENGRCVKTQSF